MPGISPPPAVNADHIPPSPVVTLDLGGTHVRAALVGQDGAVIRRLRRSTPMEAPTPAILPEMILEVAGRLPLAAVVIGVPGIVDHDAEALVHAPNLPPGWIPSINGDWLSGAVGAPVSVANDADLAAVGEASFGAGRGYRDVVYVTVSTGVGAGVVVDGSPVRGRHSGGEIGHTVIDRVAARAGLPCTVEQLGAGPAIARAAAAAGVGERDAALADRVRAGDPVASRVWNEAIEAVAVGVVNLAWLVAPQVVVIGGGVGNNSDIVLPIVSDTLRRLGPVASGDIAVVGAQLGDDAGLVGGAAWFSAIGRRLQAPAAEPVAGQARGSVNEGASDRNGRYE